MTQTVRDTALSLSCTPVKFSYNLCGVGAAWWLYTAGIQQEVDSLVA